MISDCCGAEIYSSEAYCGLTGRVLGELKVCSKCHKPCHLKPKEEDEGCQ